MKTIRWGVLGLGSIAHRVLKGFKSTPPDHTRVVAVGSRSEEKARKFAKEYGIGRSFGSYEELLRDPEVDLVYVALPNHLHKPWTLKALAAGKHVLCEKPFGMNAGEARVMIAAAKKRKRFLMEAFMYRCHPQIARLRALLKAGTVGRVRMMAGGFSYGGVNEDNCRMMLDEGGGGLMDVGCYPVSLMRLAAGEEPSSCSATGVIGKTSKVDHWAAGMMRFPGGAVAHFDCGMMVNTDWSLTIYGSDGKIKLTSPWVPGEQEAVLEVTRWSDWKTEKIPMPAKHIFANEAEAVARALRAGKLEAPEMTWADTLGNMRALDMLRASLGLKWPQERTRR